MVWDTLLATNVAATWFMVGLIWFVQIVHYPGFQLVGVERFGEYHTVHVARTTLVVAIPMLTEAATSALLAWHPPRPLLAPIYLAGFALVILIWAVTATLLVPRHHVLARSFNAATHRSLIATNWIRTTAWTVRGILMVYALMQNHSAGASK